MNEKLDQLVRRLYGASLAEKIAWELGQNDDQFIWSSASGSVILESQDEDGLPPIRLSVLDGEGRITDEEVERGRGTLAALYDLARRTALNLDKTIDGLLEELDRRDPPAPF